MDSSENIEAYFKVMGYPYDKEKMTAGPKPKTSVSFADGVWTTVFVGSKTITTTYKLGEEIDVEGTDSKSKTQVTTEVGGKLVSVITLLDGRKQTTTREFSKDGLLITMEIDGV